MSKFNTLVEGVLTEAKAKWTNKSIRSFARNIIQSKYSELGLDKAPNNKVFPIKTEIDGNTRDIWISRNPKKMPYLSGEGVDEHINVEVRDERLGLQNNSRNKPPSFNLVVNQDMSDTEVADKLLKGLQSVFSRIDKKIKV